MTCSVIELTRKAAALRRTLPSVAAVAAQLGLSSVVRGKLIDLALLAERTDLGRHDSELVTEAMRRLAEERMPLSEIHAAVRPLCVRLWGSVAGSTHDRSGREAARHERFEAGLGVVLQSCANTARMVVPHLSPKEVRAVLRELRLARGYLLDLFKRIEGGA